VAVDVAMLGRFEECVREHIPDFKVAFKSDSKVQKCLAFLMFPFAPKYGTDFITTIGSTVYFPSQAYYEKDPMGNFITLAHEFVHMWDAKRNPWFKVSYLFPQILVVLPVLLFVALAGTNAWVLAIPVLGYVLSCLVARVSFLGFCVTMAVTLAALLGVGWEHTRWALLSLVGLAVLGPWPAPWRTKWELRGYGMTIAVVQWLGVLSDKTRDQIAEMFVCSTYYFMSWSRGPIQRNLEATRQQAAAGALQRIEPFSIVYDFLRDSGLTHRA
jgi:hypothetical protein